MNKQVIGISQYVMEDLTKLPRLTFLTIFLRHNGHTYGAALFHVLRMCRDLRKFTLLLRSSDLEVNLFFLHLNTQVTDKKKIALCLHFFLHDLALIFSF